MLGDSFFCEKSGAYIDSGMVRPLARTPTVMAPRMVSRMIALVRLLRTGRLFAALDDGARTVAVDGLAIDFLASLPDARVHDAVHDVGK